MSKPLCYKTCVQGMQFTNTLLEMFFRLPMCYIYEPIICMWSSISLKALEITHFFI